MFVCYNLFTLGSNISTIAVYTDHLESIVSDGFSFEDNFHVDHKTIYGS